MPCSCGSHSHTAYPVCFAALHAASHHTSLPEGSSCRQQDAAGPDVRLTCSPQMHWVALSACMKAGTIPIQKDATAGDVASHDILVHCLSRSTLVYMLQNMSTKHPHRTEVVVPYDPDMVRAAIL